MKACVLGLMEERAETLEHGARARHRTRVEQRQKELRIVGFEPLEIVDVAYLVPDDHAKIPERIEEAVHETFFRRRRCRRQRTEQVDVGVEAEMPAAVSAERHHGELARRRRPRR